MELRPIRMSLTGWASGHTRWVLYWGPLAFKVPNCRSLRQFILGWGANLHEWEVWRSNQTASLAHIYRSIGHLVLVCRRYRVLSRPLTPQEIAELGYLDLDMKIGNFGQDREGKLVVLDYGHGEFWGAKAP